MTTIYLAGPLGFSEAGAFFHRERLVPLLLDLGYRILDPWVLADTEELRTVAAMPYGVQKRDAWTALNYSIGERNLIALDECDLMFAVLDGVDVDSGTASEIGYAFARGKPILGYRGDFRLSADNEGSIVNLQVEYFIRASGGDIIRSVTSIPEALDRIKKLKGH